jgi:hypothetical protein
VNRIQASFVETKPSSVSLDKSVNTSKIGCLLLEVPATYAALATQILRMVIDFFLLKYQARD